MTDDINDFLMGGGGKAASFEEVGVVCEGEIIDARLAQQTDMDTNAPLFWTDGRPRMQLVLTLQTEERAGPDDDGQRRLYAKGGNFEAANGSGVSMKDAIADALRKAESKKLEVGGHLKVAHTGVGKKTNRGFNAPKLFKASYKPPTVSVAADDLFDE